MVGCYQGALRGADKSAAYRHGHAQTGTQTGGYSYIDMDQNLSTAKEMIEKAISLKPNDPYIIDSLAWYYYKVGQYEDALSLLEFSIDMMPYDPTVNDHYGDVLWMLGNEIQARYYWKKAIELDIDQPLQEKIHRKLLKGIWYHCTSIHYNHTQKLIYFLK